MVISYIECFQQYPATKVVTKNTNPLAGLNSSDHLTLLTLVIVCPMRARAVWRSVGWVVLEYSVCMEWNETAAFDQ